MTVLNSNTAVIYAPIVVDMTRPHAVLARYNNLLDSQRANRNRALLQTAKRFVNKYLQAQLQLTMELSNKATGLINRLKRRKRISALKKEMLGIQQTLSNWISKTVAFFNMQII